MTVARVALVLALSGSLTSCGGSDSFTVRGALGLHGDVDSVTAATMTEGAACEGTGGYSDIVEGATVTIRDAAGKKVALGRLDAGQLGENPTSSDLRCGFYFRVRDVPGGSKVYSVEISHRGEIDFTKADAGRLVVTLG